MKRERPILFSGEMVKAILDGRKTQTRRIVKVPPTSFFEGYALDSSCAYFRNPHKYLYCPYGKVGDLLWVRETHWVPRSASPRELRQGADTWAVIYDADEPLVAEIEQFRQWRWNHTPSIHMKRKNSRLTLEITNIRVERLQEISEADAVAEGYEYKQLHAFHEEAAGMGLMKMPDDPRLWFRTLWDKINGKRAGCSWADNPYVWVIEFKRLEA